MATLLGLLALIFAGLLVLAATFYFQARGDLQTAQQKIAQIRQQANTALARYKGIDDLEKYKADLHTKVNSARALLLKFQKLAEMEQHKVQLTTTIEELKQADAQWRERISAHESNLANLVAQTEAVEETLDMQSFGFYRPKYGFDDSERYAHQLTTVRDRQKGMVKSVEATHCPTEWTVDGDAAKGHKMVKEHAKLMLRAFNGECDAAVRKVKYKNVNNFESRIDRSLKAINKLGESKQLWITEEYLNLKLQELYLVHEHREKVQTEREEQRRIKKQMREEEKALKEIEKVRKEAEQEETDKTKALEKVRQELADAHGKQMDHLQLIVDRLEAELKDTLERKAIDRLTLSNGRSYRADRYGGVEPKVQKPNMPHGMSKRSKAIWRTLTELLD